MSHQKYSELCPIYALGALDGEDLRELKTHLKSGCAECEQDIREYSDVIARLPEALGDAALSHNLKKSLMDRIEADSKPRNELFSAPVKQVSTPHRTRTLIEWLPWGLAATAALLLLATLWIILQMNHQLADQQAQLHEELKQIEQLKGELQEERLVTAFLQTPGVRVTALAGTPKSPQANGIVFWSPKATQAYFFASNLPVAPAGKTYQLWMITDKPVNAGIFGVNREGKGSLPIEGLSDTAKAQKFAVTLEPAGGVPQPTGDMQLLGSI